MAGLTEQQALERIAKSQARLKSQLEESEPRKLRNRAAGLLLQLASYSVSFRATQADGVSFLIAEDAGTVLRVLLDTSLRCHEQFLRDPKSGPHPDGGMTPDGPSSVVVHLAWLLGETAVSHELVQIACHEKVRKYVGGTGFWIEYFRGLDAFLKGHEYTPPTMKLRGMQRYWASYLDLISALTGNDAVDSRVSSISAEFQRINSDRRLTDYLCIDGDGHLPVQWNFRLASIERLRD